MVKPTNFPQAASFRDTFHWGGPTDGTDTEADWKAFWKGLFKLAKDRAIDPYVVDWCTQIHLHFDCIFSLVVFSRAFGHIAGMSSCLKALRKPTIAMRSQITTAVAVTVTANPFRFC